MSRCKQGDICQFVGSGSGDGGPPFNLGRIVICRKLYGVVSDALGSHLCWQVDPPLRTITGEPTTLCPDAWLRPLRGTNAPDESLSWAPVKRGIPA